MTVPLASLLEQAPAHRYLTRPVWSAVHRSRGLIAHATRDGHTLCGVSADHWLWAPPGVDTPRCRECEAVPDGHATCHDFAPFITYRQLDYWTRRGFLRSDNQHCGSGYRRTWPDTEYRVARLIMALQGEHHTLQGAAKKAREAVARERPLLVVRG